MSNINESDIVTDRETENIEGQQKRLCVRTKAKAGMLNFPLPAAMQGVADKLQGKGKSNQGSGGATNNARTKVGKTTSGHQNTTDIQSEKANKRRQSGQATNILGDMIDVRAGTAHKRKRPGAATHPASAAVEATIEQSPPTATIAELQIRVAQLEEFIRTNGLVVPAAPDSD